MLTLDERIARLRAHLQRKPQDHQAVAKLVALLAPPKPYALVSFDYILKARYPDDLAGIVLGPHPLLSMVSRDE